jgi:hypothetical protein
VERAMMTTLLAASFAPLLCLFGLAALCLGMEKHYREHFARAPSSRRRHVLRVLGGFSIALSFAACVAGEGGQIGPLMWFGWLSVIGLALTFIRPWLRRGARRPDRGAP